jgi:hypothetical protein
MQKIVGYWTDELARRTKAHAPFADITDAANSLKDARDQLANLKEEQSGGGTSGNQDELVSPAPGAAPADAPRADAEPEPVRTFGNFFNEFGAGGFGLPFLGAFASGIQRVSAPASRSCTRTRPSPRIRRARTGRCSAATASAAMA